MSVDPVGPDATSFNRYWYANNNPFSKVDPDGRETKDSASRACRVGDTGCNLARGDRGGSTRSAGGMQPVRGVAQSTTVINRQDLNHTGEGSCSDGRAVCFGPQVDEAKRVIDKFKIIGSGYMICYAGCQHADGVLLPNGIITLGPSAYKSESWLAANLGHEIEIHWERQMKVLGPWQDWREYHRREREACDYNIGTAWSFGNSDAEVAEFVRRSNEH